MSKPDLDQQTLALQVSAIIAALPFPAMPVITTKGEDHQDAVTSSHDLFASMLSVNILRCHQDPKHSDHHNTTLQKSMILENLFKDIHIEFLKTEPSTPDNDILYSIFQKHFRSYALLYPSSPDLRFYPIEHVARGDLIHTQTIEHVLAIQRSMSSQDNILDKHTLEALSYPALILQLASTLLDIYYS